MPEHIAAPPGYELHVKDFFVEARDVPRDAPPTCYHLKRLHRDGSLTLVATVNIPAYHSPQGETFISDKTPLPFRERYGGSPPLAVVEPGESLVIECAGPQVEGLTPLVEYGQRDVRVLGDFRRLHEPTVEPTDG